MKLTNLFRAIITVLFYVCIVSASAGFMGMNFVDLFNHQLHYAISVISVALVVFGVLGALTFGAIIKFREMW